MNPECMDRFYVLGQLVEAVRMLSESSKTAALLMEVRSNLAMAIQGAQNIEDVAGIPGRLTEVFGKITAPAYPAWKASKNTATVLLNIMKYDSTRRAVMEIRYTAELVELIRKNGISIRQLKLETGNPLEELFASLIDASGFPVLFYMEGGFAREGAIVVTGETAVDVAERVLKIANL